MSNSTTPTPTTLDNLATVFEASCSDTELAQIWKYRFLTEFPEIGDHPLLDYSIEGCWYYEEYVQVMTGRAKKLGLKVAAAAAKMANRATYLPSAYLSLYGLHTEDNSVFRVQGERGLAPSSLMGLMFPEKGLLSLRLLNSTGLRDNEIPAEVWSVCRKMGYRPSQGNLLILKELVPFLARAFPLAIDFEAYVHRLFAPALPGAMWKKAQFTFSVPRGADGKEMKVDGSGMYNPNHPDLEGFVAMYGKVVMQITSLNEKGVFMKGILRPVEGLPDNVSFAPDPGQVKGAWKGKFKEGEVTEGYLTVLQVWRKNKAVMPAGFEQLQFVSRNGETEALVASLLKKAINKLLEGGAQALLEQLQDLSDETLWSIKLCKMVGANPLAIESVKKAVADRLRAASWNIATGAGIEGLQRVVVIDATLKQGTCVTPGFKPGTTLAGWRFPTVLPQGLVEMNVVEPVQHHLVDGELPPGIIFVHPEDITLRMQGDDDGDIIAISSDPRVIKLWRARIFKGLYHIEPIGEKFPTPTLSFEGEKYGEVDPRGPVGIATIEQARLGQVGSGNVTILGHVLAMAVCCQYYIDAAKKRATRAPHPGKLSVLGNWQKKEDGSYTFNLQANAWPTEISDKDPLAVRENSKLVKKVLHQAGYPQFGEEKVEVLSWYYQSWVDETGKTIQKKGRIDPFQAQKDTIGTGMVSFSYNCFLANIQGRLEGLKQELGGVIMPTQDLLKTALKLDGWRTKYSSYQNYMMSLHNKAGFEAWKAGWAKVYRAPEEEREEMATELKNQLWLAVASLSLSEVLEIWWWENSAPPQIEEWSDEKVAMPSSSRAWWVLTAPTCSVVEKLGMGADAPCQWAVPHKDGVVKIVLQGEDPWKTFIERAYNNKAHLQATGVHLTQCNHCMSLLSSAILQEWRKSGEFKMKVGALVKGLNADLKKVPYPVKEEKVHAGQDGDMMFY